MDKNGIFAKWLIHGLDGYCFGSDLELYRLPFESDHKYYGLRKLKMQHPNRWIINGKWWSKRQLKQKLYLNSDPFILIEDKDLPF
jgi:hypothetical protein